nr:uncharacterized mitochondrial protein AtMg00810-like [Tanacetum cinerariifolium]
MPPKPYLSYTGLDEFANKTIVENKSSEEETKVVRKNTDALIIEEWVSNDEKENVTQPKIVKKIVQPSIVKKEQVNVAHPKTIVNVVRSMSYLSKTAHSTVKTPFHKNTTFKNSNIVTAGSKNVNTARPKVVVNAVKGNLVNDIKASACWVWKPKTKVIDHVSKHNSASITLKKFDYINAQGRSNKAFRVFNSSTRIVDENLHIRFSENTPNVVGTQSNGFSSTKASDNAYLKSSHYDGFKPSCDDGKKVDEDPRKDNNEFSFDPNMPTLEDISTFNFLNDQSEDDDEMANMNNLDTTIQMDVKSTFLYEKIEEEVYVCQPPGFKDPNFLDRVYKVKKPMYGLHQAPKSWYETLSTYLLDNGFQRGKIDKTLFIKRYKGDILLVQVYVDDIIFGSTSKELCNAFEKLMHEKFQMSSMGELTFFLGLQVKQKNDGIFISQNKYVAKILKKFGFTKIKNASTPMETQKPLIKDKDGEEVNVHIYRSMIGSLMYFTSSRPTIMFAVRTCARYQVNPKVSRLHAVKRIFRYLKGHPKLGR